MNVFESQLPELAVGFLTAFLVCLVLILTRNWHGHLTLDGHSGIQKFHADPTPRVGGLGIMIAGVAVWMSAGEARAGLLGPMLLAGLPAFLFGILEDLTKQVSVRTRLLATMASGVLAWWLTGTSLTRVDVWGLDYLLTWLPLSIAFTAFAVGGVANAVNIIDGFNGLAAGSIIICLASLGAIAYLAGDPLLAQVCLILGSITLGFMALNFPFGKIFLGDGGAYLLGFLLAWVAILLPMRNPEVSAWAGLLACGYPILETLFSIARRHRRCQHPVHADRLHLHSLIKCRVSRKKLPHWPLVLRNAAVSPVLWIYSLLPAGLAIQFWSQTWALVTAFIFCALVYAVFYARLIYFRWQMPKLN
jgi:UDP-N-acetylmuramyl pentapeptide phosphotransferase/UDP-N-acetylglucosamine-1-phosphate transferase